MKFKFKLYYFILFLFTGIFAPYLALYLFQKGYSGVQIGLLLGSMPIASLLLQPVWSYLSDVFNTRRAILLVTNLGAGLAIAGLGLAKSFEWALIFGVLFSAFRSPILSITHAIVLDNLADEDKQAEFSRVRLWGSVSFGLSSLVLGSFFLDQILNYFTWFLLGLSLLLAGLSLLLPEPGEKFHYAGLKGLRFISRNTGFAIFLLASVFIGATLSISINYQTLFLESLEASPWLLGLTVSLQAFLEIPLMFLVPFLIRKISLRGVILAGAVVLPIRWFLYLFIQNPAWIVPTQALHGMSIVSFFVVGVTFIDQQIPKKWRGTGQGLYSTAMHGVGSSLGLYFAGIILDWFDVRAIWGLALALGLVGLGLLLAALRRLEPAG